MSHERLEPEYLFDQEKINQLKKVAPECFEDGKINFTTLKQNLGEWVLDEDEEIEHFGLSWPGKKEARRLASIPSQGTLEPMYGEGLKPDGNPDSDGLNDSKNIFIEGENLEVLKILQKSYAGKIKMIYIDPPYNTGNDFVYDDDFTEPLQEYLRRTKQVDEEGKPLTTNKRADGRFHSKWLSMMYPRLRLARNLLREDGVIFISIDDNEVNFLKMLMNEIFGEENFVESIVWNKRIPKNDKGIGNIHEYILVYVKSEASNQKFLMTKEGLEDVYSFVDVLKKKKIPIPEAEKKLKKFYSKKGFDRGITLYKSLYNDYKIWGKINVSWPNSNTDGPTYDVLHPKLNIPVTVPDRGWRWKKGTFDDLLDYEKTIELHDGSFKCGQIWFSKDEKTQPSSIKYLDDVNDLLLRSILSMKSSGGIEVEKLLAKSVFSYPKPKELIKTLIRSNINKGDIVLDFFAGSSTLGNAIFEINQELKLDLSFIQIQLPEVLDETKKEHKAAIKFCKKNGLELDLFQISKERLKRAHRILKSNDGYKIFKLQKSNFKLWTKYSGNNILDLESNLDLFNQNPLQNGWSQNGLMTEIVLMEGFSLSSFVVNKSEYNKNVVVKVSDEYCEHSLLICLDEKVHSETIDHLKLSGQDIFICLDSAISNVEKLRLSDKGIIKTI